MQHVHGHKKSPEGFPPGLFALAVGALLAELAYLIVL